MHTPKLILALTIMAGAHASKPPLSSQDEARALKPSVPMNSHVMVPADSKDGVRGHLNAFMKESMPGAGIAPCESFSNQDLDRVINRLVNHAHPSFQKIYQAKCHTENGCDKRSMVSGSSDLQELLESSDESLVVQAAKQVVKEGKCHEAVMLYYHHLDEPTKSNLLKTNSFKLPLLPERSEALQFLKDYYKAITEEDTHRKNRILGIVHGHHWSSITAEEQLALQQQTFARLNTTQVQQLLQTYNKQSPCALAHRKQSAPWTEDTVIEAGFTPEEASFYAEAFRKDTFSLQGIDPEDVPDTTLKGSGYIGCDQAAANQCLEGGDRQYKLQAVVRAIKVPGSGKIPVPDGIGMDATMQGTFGEDLVFQTRSFEGMPDSPSQWGPDKAGGDGTQGLLGPAFVASPGEKVHIFVKNNFADAQKNLGPSIDSAQDYWNRIEIIRNLPTENYTTQGFAPWIPYSGPQWPQDQYPFNNSEPVPADEMKANAGYQNVPGYETSGFDVFNLHMHGWEVAPHLFYPPGTSDPNADWISIHPDPNSGQQCMCYTLELSESQSRGDFIYHTHRHGTSTILTWSGMFGLSLTGEELSVEEARNKTEDSPPTLTSDLINIVEQEGLEFTDDDVNFVVIYDSAWAYADYMNETTMETTTIVSDFLSATSGHEGPQTMMLEPFFVNNEYQPTIQARTGALTEFRIVCVSAGKICAFQIMQGDGISDNSTLVPFDRVASDGITYEKPVHRRANGNPLLPDASASEAYLSMGGGMREVVAVQFETPGIYTVWQRSIAFDDGIEQMLMTVNVTGEPTTRKPIEQHTLESYRPLIPEDRQITEYRGLSFGTNYDQETYPFPFYSVGNINGQNSTSYNVNHFDIGLGGGTCALWVIRSLDVNTHPFHIHVNPFQVIHSSSHWFEDNKALFGFMNDYTFPWDTERGTALSNIWRDTAMVPPFGYLVIKQCYDAGVAPSLDADVESFAGKFVFHCHFLSHEDTGLIRNVILKGNATSSGSGSEEPVSEPPSNGNKLPSSESSTNQNSSEANMGSDEPTTPSLESTSAGIYLAERTAIALMVLSSLIFLV